MFSYRSICEGVCILMCVSILISSIKCDLVTYNETERTLHTEELNHSSKKTELDINGRLTQAEDVLKQCESLLKAAKETTPSTFKPSISSNATKNLVIRAATLNTSSRRVHGSSINNTLFTLNCCSKNENGTLTCECLTNMTHLIDGIMEKDELTSIEIHRCHIPIFNLSAFSNFKKLENLSVTQCNMSRLLGILPVTIKVLNLSSNPLTSLEDGTFSAIKIPLLQNRFGAYGRRGFSSLTLHKNDEQQAKKKTLEGPMPTDSTKDKDGTRNESDLQASQGTSLMTQEMKVEVIDLSNNKISELPKSIFTLARLKYLFISGNVFKGDFVWDKLWEWTKGRNFSSLLVDADDALTQFQPDEGSSLYYKYSVLGALKAKDDLETICGNVNKAECWNCSLFGLQRDLEKGSRMYRNYPVSHRSPKGSVSIALSLDCSNSNLTEIPRIPRHTWHLNVSHNLIRNLTTLAEPQYLYLQGLDADYNQIDIKTLARVPLLHNYARLNLRHNAIASFPLNILESMKSLQDVDDKGRGHTSLGGNDVECDCTTFLQIRGFFLRHRNKLDTKDIYCKDFKTHTPLVDIRYPDLCPIPVSKVSLDDSQSWIWVLIGVEVLLIASIILKVWYDKRIYRKTGQLPWISKKMPRLPCDTILEGLKDIKEHQHNILSKKKDTSSLASFQNSNTLRKDEKLHDKRRIVRFNLKTSRSNSDASQVTAGSGNSHIVQL